jgi:hypothetical protein
MFAFGPGLINREEEKYNTVSSKQADREVP